MGQMEEGRLSVGARFPERRSAPRFAFDAHLEILDPLEHKQIAGRVSVLSQTGCFARTQTPIAHRAVVQVHIRKDDSVFETWARATPNHPGTETGAVLVFLDTQPEQAKVLASWLDELARTVEDAAARAG
jgi:hypothetical protein